MIQTYRIDAYNASVDQLRAAHQACQHSKPSNVLDAFGVLDNRQVDIDI